MRDKRIICFLALCVILAFVPNTYAAEVSTPSTVLSQSSTTSQVTSTTPATTSSTSASSSASDSSSSASPFAGLIGNDDGMRPIRPLDLNAMGDRAVHFGDRSFNLFQKGSIPLVIWGIGGSVMLMVLGIFFGKKVILAGVTGVLICLIAVVLIHYMPEIVLSVKNAAGSAISP